MYELIPKKVAHANVLGEIYFIYGNSHLFKFTNQYI